jgi:hypothetical protein
MHKTLHENMIFLHFFRFALSMAYLSLSKSQSNRVKVCRVLSTALSNIAYNG